MSTPAQPAPKIRRYQDAITDLPWPRAITSDSASGSRFLITTPCIVVGWSVRETSGSAPAAMQLFSGNNSTGQILADVGMVANDGKSAGPGWPGIPAPDGLYLFVKSGAFDGAVWVIPVNRGGDLPMTAANVTALITGLTGLVAALTALVKVIRHIASPNPHPNAKQP